MKKSIVNVINKILDERNMSHDLIKDKLNSIGLKYHQLMLNKPRLRHTEFKGYHYIDNCAVLKSSRFEGVWSDLVEKDLKITVFDSE